MAILAPFARQQGFQIFDPVFQPRKRALEFFEQRHGPGVVGPTEAGVTSPQLPHHENRGDNQQQFKKKRDAVRHHDMAKPRMSKHALPSFQMS